MPLRKRHFEKLVMISSTEILILNNLEAFGLPKKPSEDMKTRIAYFITNGWITENGNITSKGAAERDAYYAQRKLENDPAL